MALFPSYSEFLLYELCKLGSSTDRFDGRVPDRSDYDASLMPGSMAIDGDETRLGGWENE